MILHKRNSLIMSHEQILRRELKAMLKCVDKRKALTLTLYFNPSCTSKEETPYEDNKYYYSDYFVLLKVLENKHSETYKIEGLA